MAMGNSDRTTPEATSRALRALLHPAALASLGILLLNDHVLKEALPGPLTGKLSDLAGLVFFPLLVTALLGLLRLPARVAFAVSGATVGVWFTAIKTLGPAAAATEGLAEVFIASSTIVVDPTDLVALPMIGVALWIFASTRADATVRHASILPSRRALELTALSIGAVASMATSCSESVGFTDLIVEGPLVYAQQGGGATYVSSDGFQTQTQTDRVESDGARSDACLPDGTCYRINGGPFVEQKQPSDGQSWTIAWEFPPDRLEFVGRSGDSCDPYDVYSYDIVLIDGPDGPIVLVAMGDDGVLRRNADGTWERGVVGSPAPLGAWGENIERELLGVVSIGVLLAAVTALVSRRKSEGHERIRIGGWAVFGLVIFVGASVIGLASDPADSFLSVAPVLVPISWAAAAAAIAAIWTRIAEVRGRSTWQLVRRTTAIIVAATAIAALAFLLWSSGSIPAWNMAFGIAIVSFVIGIGALIAVVSNTPGAFDEQSTPSEETEPTPDDEPTNIDADSEVEFEDPEMRITPTARLWAFAGGCWVAAAVLPPVIGWWLPPFGGSGLLLLLAPVLAFAAAYFAARASGHRSPISRAIVSSVVGYVVAFLTPFLTTILLFPATWAVAVIAIRPKTRWVWVSRVLLIVGSVALAVSLGGVDSYFLTSSEVLARAFWAWIMPFAVIATDMATTALVTRLRNRSPDGQDESDRAL